MMNMLNQQLDWYIISDYLPIYYCIEYEPCQDKK